jgi:hypothetical protein
VGSVVRGTGSIIADDRDESSGVGICSLYAHPATALPLRGNDPGRGEAAIMMHADTKKDVHTALEIHYNTSRHEHTPRGGGLARVAGQSCLAGPSVLQLYP